MIDNLLAKLRGALKSWTVWANGLLLMALPFLPVLQDSLPQLQAYLPENFYKWAMLGVLVGNIALRFKTTTSLAEK